MTAKEVEIDRLRSIIRDLRARLFGWEATTLSRAEWDDETYLLCHGPAAIISEVPPRG